MLTVTVAALLFAWAVYASAGAKEKRYDAAMEACEYGAYVAFTEKLRVIAETEGDAASYAAAAAGEALSRYMLFSGLDADADGLYGLLVSGAVDSGTAAELISAVDKGKTREESVLAAIEIARGMENNSRVSAERDEGGWEWLSSLPEVKEADAQKTAERFIGGKGKVRGAVSHTFPLVYAYVNGNASAEVTRMGGRLIRMYKFPIGTAQRRGEEECVSAAERFLRSAGIKDAEVVSQTSDADGMTFVFVSGEDGDGGEVSVKVAFAGATVIYFDAYEYYKYR